MSDSHTEPLLCADLTAQIQATFQHHENWPKPGVTFVDALPLFQHPELVERALAGIAAQYAGQADAVAALDARGFLLGPGIAKHLDVPFIAVRKAGKLPGECVSCSYDLEYGSATIEVQKSAMAAASAAAGSGKPARVLLVDDLLATGGTLAAAVQCVEAAGGKAVAAAVLCELPVLGGRTRLGCVPVRTVVTL